MCPGISGMKASGEEVGWQVRPEACRHDACTVQASTMHALSRHCCLDLRFSHLLIHVPSCNAGPPRDALRLTLPASCFGSQISIHCLGIPLTITSPWAQASLLSCCKAKSTALGDCPAIICPALGCCEVAQNQGLQERSGEEKVILEGS
eukprot:1157067-Pelagomonas_calceolata.AAC.8